MGAMRYILVAVGAVAISAACGASRVDWSLSARAKPHVDPTTYRAPAPQRYAVHTSRRPERVYAYVRHERRAHHRHHRRSWKCEDRVRGVGTQWIGTDGALNAARKDWMERVRYDFGEVYLDMTNARDEEFRCSRTSIGEVAGQTFYRCEIWATPCKAKFQEDATLN